MRVARWTLLCLLAGCDQCNPKETGDTALPEFGAAKTCGTCHPDHLREWEGSVMHYAAGSPTFNAFELVARQKSEGAVAADGANPNFCVGCHSPIGVMRDEFPDYVDAASAEPAFDAMSAVAAEGVSCDFCHTVTGPDLEGSPSGDGIGNASLLNEPGYAKQGPIDEPWENSYHEAERSEYLQSSEFCGSCHDVRIPVEDAVTGEPFLRLENLFTEWQTGPYATEDNPWGTVVRCQDCHMSLYPLEPPGTFPEIRVAQYLDTPVRPHAVHAFTAVSAPLTDDYPNLDTEEVDASGFPVGQEQRREMFLRAAATLTLEGTRSTLSGGGTVLPVLVTVENTGTGHNLPSGFSQERECWIELVVRDDAGVLYESGYLRDAAHPETGEDAPDGLLDDEELDHGHFHYDDALERYVLEPGPDRNQRPEQNLGLVNFQNAFIYVDGEGTWHEVDSPMDANHMDNTRSLPPLVPRTYKYDVPIERALVGDVTVSARLRFRTFPPHFLRKLAAAAPELVSEETLDRNRIIDIAEDTVTVTVE